MVADNVLIWNHIGIELGETVAVEVVGNAINGIRYCHAAIQVIEGSTTNSIQGNALLGCPWGLILASQGNQYSDNRHLSSGPINFWYWDPLGGNIDGGRNVH